MSGNVKSFKKNGKYSDYRLPPDKKGKWEKHIPGYNFCGPGTQVKERLERGDYGVNDLDNACRLHDVEYMIYNGDAKNLRMSDEKLATAARLIKNDIEREEGIVKRMGIGSRIANWIMDKTGISTIGNIIIAGYDPAGSSQGVKYAANIVSSVFDGKGFLEDLGIVDPVYFASNLNNDKKAGDVKVEGRKLFEKYFN